MPYILPLWVKTLKTFISVVNKKKTRQNKIVHLYGLSTDCLYRNLELNSKEKQALPKRAKSYATSIPWEGWMVQVWVCSRTSCATDGENIQLRRNQLSLWQAVWSGRMDWNVKAANERSVTCPNNFFPQSCPNFAEEVAVDKKLGV